MAERRKRRISSPESDKSSIPKVIEILDDVNWNTSAAKRKYKSDVSQTLHKVSGYTQNGEADWSRNICTTITTEPQAEAKFHESLNRGLTFTREANRSDTATSEFPLLILPKYAKTDTASQNWEICDYVFKRKQDDVAAASVPKTNVDTAYEAKPPCKSEQQPCDIVNEISTSLYGTPVQAVECNTCGQLFKDHPMLLRHVEQAHIANLKLPVNVETRSDGSDCEVEIPSSSAFKDATKWSPDSIRAVASSHLPLKSDDSDDDIKLASSSKHIPSASDVELGNDDYDANNDTFDNGGDRHPILNIKKLVGDVSNNTEQSLKGEVELEDSGCIPGVDRDDKVNNRGKFSCTECSKTYAHRKSLNKHMKQEHDNVGNGVSDVSIQQNMLKCYTCTRRFKNVKEFLNHVANCNNKGNNASEISTAANQADGESDETSELNDTVPININVKNTGNSRAVSAVVSAAESAEDRGSFPCSECSHIYAHKTVLNTHFKEMHSTVSIQNTNVSIQSAKFQCYKCTSWLKNITELENHVQKCSIEENKNASKIATTTSNAADEVNESAKNDPASLVIDDKLHEIKKYKMEDFANIECKEEATSDTLSTDQSSTDKAGEIHTCDICNSSFSSRKLVKLHEINMHRKLKKCHCGKTFAREEYCNHIEFCRLISNTDSLTVKEKEENATVANDKMFQCKICSDRVASRDHALIHSKKHPFSCSFCGYSNRGRYRCKRHIDMAVCYDRSKAKTMPVIKIDAVCVACNRKFTDANLFVDHWAKEHAVILTQFVNCKICSKLYPRQTLTAHVQVAHLRRFVCDVCGNRYGTAGRLKNHQLSHEKPTFSCSECDKMFTRPALLLQHKSRVHKTEKNSVFCDICGVGLKSAATLKAHITTLHSTNDEKRFSCSVCNKKFAVKQSMQIHMESHVSVRALKCSQCSKLFKTDQHLKRHIDRTHNAVRKFACEQCSAAFKRENHLQAHMLKHTGARDFPCDLCDKRFSRKQILQTHRLSHTGERPFSCDECSKSFITKTSLNKHMKEHHDGIENNLVV